MFQGANDSRRTERSSTEFFLERTGCPEFAESLPQSTENCTASQPERGEEHQLQSALSGVDVDDTLVASSAFEPRRPRAISLVVIDVQCGPANSATERALFWRAQGRRFKSNFSTERDERPIRRVRARHRHHLEIETACPEEFH